MRIEIKGLLIAAAAALVVLGATFGVAALVRRGQDGIKTEKQAAPPGKPTPPVSAAVVAQGRLFYTQSCASCHGDDAKGAFGPNLHNEDMSDARMTTVIKNGKGRMPAFTSKYNDSKTQTLVAYIRTLK